MASQKPKLRDRPKSVALTNQKGGVGKSTTTLNVACAAVELGARVLVRDLDPQANVTSALDPQEVEYTMNDVLRPDDSGEVVEGCLGSAIRPAGGQWPKGLYVVPATLALAERETDQSVGRELRLRTTSLGCLDVFDLVLDDCPPSVGQLTVNALAADDEVLIVTQAAKWAVAGTHQAHRTIRRVIKYYNSELRFLGVQITAYEDNRVEPRTRYDELAQTYPGMLWEPIPRIEIINKAVGAEAPLSAYGSESQSARAYYTKIAERLLNGS
jgi:chromosome partitioning protein